MKLIFIGILISNSNNNMSFFNNFFGSSNTDSNATNINICLVGCVSAGKSTILNAFFGRDYAQCKIKRTTMMPNKFAETNQASKIDPSEKISKTISDVNAQIYTQTDRGTKPLKLEDYGYELTFYVECMEMNLGNNIQICIYDIPGLNDARTKDVYYSYLEKNFYKFNIILFVVDIQSGLNTSDEMDILRFLSSNISKQKTQSGKNISLLGIVNKADDMQFTADGGLEVLGELGEMFEQTSNTIKQEFEKKNIKQNLLGCVPVCGLDSHLYRMIRKYKDINKLMDENILRIGVNEEGSKFRKLSKAEQRRKVQEKIQDQTFVNDMIMLSGFGQIERALKTYIGSKGSNMVMENLLYEYNCLEEMTERNLFPNLKKRIEVLSNIQTHSESKYDEEMKKNVKQLNTIIYRKINLMNSPTDIKTYYDASILNQIKADKFLCSKLVPNFYSITTYPGYFTDRILELVIAEFSEQAVPIHKLSYIELFKNTGNLKIDIIDIVLDSLMTNPRGTNTFIFNENEKTQFDYPHYIKLFDNIKFSSKFIDFLRFCMANIYTNCLKSEELVGKLMIFTLYEEIPMRQFINDLRIEKNLINTNRQINVYSKGLGSSYAKHNLLELYYIAKCREIADDENFLSHNKPITIDFSNII